MVWTESIKRLTFVHVEMFMFVYENETLTQNDSSREKIKILYEDPEEEGKDLFFTSAGWINENMHECFHQDADLNFVRTEDKQNRGRLRTWTLGLIR